MVKFEHKRALLLIRFRDKKFEWHIDTRYWRNPLLGVLVLALLPLIFSNKSDILTLIGTANIYAAIALPLSWQMTGIGRLNFGPQFFVGLGGYVAGLLSALYMWGPWATLPVAILAGVLFGLLMSPLTSLAKGLYFSLITLIIPLIFLEVTYYFTIFRGETGLFGILPLISLSNTRIEYVVACYFSLILMITYLYIIHRINESRVGIYTAAINDDEDVASNLGLNVKGWKIVCFVVTSVMITVVGWFAAHFYGTFAGVTYLPMPFMLKILLVVMIGGRGDVYGAIYGAYFVVILEKLLTPLGEINYFIFPLILMILLYTLREGLYGIYRKHHYREYYPTIRVRKR